MSLKALTRQLDSLKDPERAKILMRFFKTGPGEYGEGDIFAGVRVPMLRKLAKQFRLLSLPDVKKLLKARTHEKRFIALVILIWAYRSGTEGEKKSIYELYTSHTEFINNWDLVDISAEHIVGSYLFDKDKAPLYLLAGSVNLWERRISILATFHYIKQGQFSETLKIAKLLLNDPEDLVHKAVGWMLREVGKRSLKTEEEFLALYYTRMPRTMLRYAIEKFPDDRRWKYLHGLIS